MPPDSGSGGRPPPAPELEELELLELELEHSEPPAGGSPPTSPALSPLPSGIGVMTFQIQIAPSYLMVYQKRNPLASGCVYPSFGLITDLAKNSNDRFFRSFESLACRALVNSQNSLSKSFFVFRSVAFLSLLLSKSERVFQAFPDHRIARRKSLIGICRLR